jgi:hypothetical protein
MLSHVAHAEKLPDQRAAFGGSGRNFAARDGALHAKNDVVALNRGSRGPYDFAEAPAQTIAIDGAGNRLAADHVANPPGSTFGRRGDQLEEATIDPATRTKDGFECFRAAKPIQTAGAGAQASNRSDGKPRAALGPTRREHLASADRLHAASKAVLACAAKLRGLKCAFHGSGVIIRWKSSAASEWPGVAAWARRAAAEKPYIRAR